MYENRSVTQSAERRESSRIRDRVKTPSVKSDVDESTTKTLDLSESKNRRLLELRLLHHYDTKTSLSIPGYDEPTTTELWTTTIPQLAFENDALLFSIMIRTYAFAVLQERPLTPYAPPSQFLYMTSGALRIFQQTWSLIGDDESSIAVQSMKNLTIWSEGKASFEESWMAPFHKSNGMGLSHLLQSHEIEDPPALWSSRTREAYQSTVNYIGSVQIAITAGEAGQDILRRLLVFPVLIPTRFIALVVEQQPRALVVLAHYFALVARFKHPWWIGDGGRREIRGIQSALSAEWSYLMSWPLSATEEGS
ncbi:hypothetical protein MMC27_003190 [Xylographa pallens]|nr:hypothetical protein [Xylographa pallens]